MWDLMMKNVYRIGGGDINPDEFDLDIFYEDPGKGFKRFLPAEANIENRPLLNLFDLDKLTSPVIPSLTGNLILLLVLRSTRNWESSCSRYLEPFGTTIKNAILAAGGIPKVCLPTTL